MVRARFRSNASLLVAALGLAPRAVLAAPSSPNDAKAPAPPVSASPPSDGKAPASHAAPARPSDGKAPASHGAPLPASNGKAPAPHATPAAPPPSAPAADGKTPTPLDVPSAAPGDPPNPKRGVGARSVNPAPEPAASASAPMSGGTPDTFVKPSKAEPAHKPDKPDKLAARAAHQKGKPPHRPSPTLPADAPRAMPNRVARQNIAEGFTDEDLRAGKDDPELRSLKAAERVLFPQPLRGVESGWSWDLPHPLSSDGADASAPSAPSFVMPDARRGELSGEPDAAWLKSLALPNLPVVLDEFVIKYLRFYRDSPSGKSIAKVWAKKSGRYTAAMRDELARAGVPTDLVWLSMIESGHNPNAMSPAGAAGLWQFLPDAARNYGLTVDRWVDERLDPERSTEAAGRYLSDLYRRFGSWDLAIASYNMGYGGLSRSIRKFNSNDFWELVRYEAGVPWETALYVPKIFALAIVMNNKGAFGLDTVEVDPPETFDVVLVGASVALSDVARAAGVDESRIEALNPGYLAGRTPPWSVSSGVPKPSFRVRVPAGKGVACTSALALTARDDDTPDTYLSKFGDTMESIANAQGMSEARLRALNHVEPKEILSPGTLLLVPRGARTAAAEVNDEVVVVPPREFSYAGRKRLFYRVAPGDTLARVAHEFSLSASELGSWNALDEGARLQPGMVLQLFVDQSQTFAARTLPALGTRVLVAGSPEFYDYFEAQNGRKRVIVAARDNDTLSTLGKRYGMTVGSMERINRRSRTDKLQAGESVVVYVDRGRAVTTHPPVDGDRSDSSSVLPLEPASEPASDFAAQESSAP